MLAALWLVARVACVGVVDADVEFVVNVLELLELEVVVVFV